jgi:hypothetical protein
MEWTRDNQTYVYWRGPDNGLWQTWTINDAWSGQNNESFVRSRGCASGPAIASSSPSALPAARQNGSKPGSEAPDCRAFGCSCGDQSSLRTLVAAEGEH